jgi:hypothetical protein
MKSFWCWAGATIVVTSLAAGARARADEGIRYVILKSKSNRTLVDNQCSGTDGNSLSQLPTGEQTLGGIKFSVGPGVIQLGSKAFDSYPEKVEGIVVDYKLTKLYILHATCNGGGPNTEGSEGHVKDGTLIGQYLVHYEDQSAEGIPIVYGEDVRDWWYVDGEKEPSRSKVVWSGGNEFATEVGAKLRLYASTWTNPKPDKKVARIDYIALKAETRAAPFCIAITTTDK